MSVIALSVIALSLPELSNFSTSLLVRRLKLGTPCPIKKDYHAFNSSGHTVRFLFGGGGGPVTSTSLIRGGGGEGRCKHWPPGAGDLRYATG